MRTDEPISTVSELYKGESMSKLICVGMLESAVYSKMHENSRRVYSENSIAPTIHTSGGATRR